MSAAQQPTTQPVSTEREYVCGTRRAITVGPGDHRVICATCRAGGSVKHPTRELAVSAATRDSNKPCSACGAQ